MCSLNHTFNLTHPTFCTFHGVCGTRRTLKSPPASLEIFMVLPAFVVINVLRMKSSMHAPPHPTQPPSEPSIQRHEHTTPPAYNANPMPPIRCHSHSVHHCTVAVRDVSVPTIRKWFICVCVSVCVRVCLSVCTRTLSRSATARYGTTFADALRRRRRRR